MTGLDDVPRVPGYRTDRLLGFGGTGEVWAAVTEDGGEPVALKVLRVPEEETDRLLRETALLRRVDHPHVVRLRTVARVPGHGPVLVLDRALGGSLGALVSARGPLDVGEVVTVLTPLAGALADLHERGIVHGDVAPGNVLFDSRGRPLLGDLSAARVVGEGADPDVRGTPGYADPALAAGAPPTPASDVHGLAAVCWLALTGRAPRPAGERPPLVALAAQVPVDLAVLLDEALDADPQRRPTARELAARAFDAAPAAPVRLVPTDPGAAPAEVVTHRLRAAAAQAPPLAAHRGRRRWPAMRRWRPTAAAGVVGLVLVVTGTLVVPRLLDGRGELESPAAPASAPVAPTTAAAVPGAVRTALEGDEPAAAVPALAWLRARGFATGDRSLIEQASVPGSSALDADLELLQRLAQAGVVLDGLGFDVRSTQLVSRDGDVAVVDATVVTTAHRQVDAAGQVVDHVPEGEPRTSRLVLRRGADGWRVERLG